MSSPVSPDMRDHIMGAADADGCPRRFGAAVQPLRLSAASVA